MLLSIANAGAGKAQVFAEQSELERSHRSTKLGIELLERTRMGHTL